MSPPTYRKRDDRDDRNDPDNRDDRDNGDDQECNLSYDIRQSLYPWLAFDEEDYELFSSITF